MKLTNLLEFYTNKTQNKTINKREFYNPFANNYALPKLKTLQADVVSFKAKNYDSSSIKSSTNHCAYCGSKVYTQRQLEVLTAELMQQKSNSLQGKIRSIVEKLGGKSDNALIQKKREVNSENLLFFEKFSNLVAENPSKSGEEILTEFLKMDKAEIPPFLLTQISPLLKTIDHVVPQRQEVDNDNEELNLVESCFTCNSKIKNGSSFRSFYFTYPTIKDTMPKEKFEFASLGILEHSPDVIVSKMNTEELVRVIDGLFDQRSTIRTALFAIEEKIKNCTNSIKATIDKIKGERETKQIEKRELQDQAKTYEEDEEFRIIQKRRDLTNSVREIKGKIEELSASSTRQTRNIQTWRNRLSEMENKQASKPKANKKGKQAVQYSPEEKAELEKKISDAEATIRSNANERGKLNELLEKKEAELNQLNMQHPDIDSLKAEKTRLEGLINSHSQIKTIKQRMDELNAQISNLEQQKSANEQAQAEVKEKMPNLSSATEEEKAQYQQYIELTSALKEAEESLEAKDKTTKLIASIAKPQLEAQIALLEENPFVINHHLTEELENLTTANESIQNSLRNAKKQLSQYESQLVMHIDKVQEFNQNEEEGIPITSFSLKDMESRISTITSMKEKVEKELETIPEDIVIDAEPQNEELQEEYNKLIEEIDSIKKELTRQMSKSQREQRKKELDALEASVALLCDKDGNILSGNNMRILENLESHLEQLQKGLQSTSKGKAKDTLIRQIEEIKQEISEMADNDPVIFNFLNGRKRDELTAKRDKYNSQLATLIEQRDAIKQRLELTGTINDGFNQSETETQISQLEEQIKRLNEKTIWLELPDKIRKIDAEIKIQNENILALEQKLTSIQE